MNDNISNPIQHDDNIHSSTHIDEDVIPENLPRGAYLNRKYFKRYLNLALNNLAEASGKISLVADNFISEMEKIEAEGKPIREDYRQVFEALQIAVDGINEIGPLLVKINNSI